MDHNKQFILLLSFILLSVGCNSIKKDNTSYHFSKSLISSSKRIHTFSNSHPIHFVNEKTGWAVFSKGKIYKTVDGGYKWIEQQSGINDALYSVWFYDENSGLAVGSNATILTTSNGGKNWLIKKPPANSCLLKKSETKQTLFFCQYLTKNICYANGGHCLIKSTDNGNTFSENLIPNNDILQVYFFNENIGWLSSFDKIYRTLDGGVSWNSSPSIPGDPVCMFFIDQYNGYGWVSHLRGHTWDAQLCKTVNGGKNWVMIDKVSSKIYLLSLSFVNSNQGYAIDKTSIYKTNDSGANWNKIFDDKANTPVYQFIFCFDDKHAWVLGNVGDLIIISNE